METASPPDPFVSRNGADTMFRNGVEDEDFGPETDVDLVDDVLMSPTIAAAKALVAGCQDDHERQRQQMADFDDPADLDPRRDTPTPPAHEVVGNATVDPLGESGGEESEEEWNYIPGKDTNAETDSQDQEDMSSQLNPNAAEFVPVSPTTTRLLMMDDAIISASPQKDFDTSMDNIQIPSEEDFVDEISHRPGDLGHDNGLKSKHTDDYFMRDNFSSLCNNSPDINSTSTCAQMGDDSTISFLSSLNNSASCVTEQVQFEKLHTVKNLSGGRDFIFGSEESFSNSAVGGINEFDKQDLMTTSLMDGDFTQSSESDDNLIPGTPKSMIVEAPLSPSNEDILPINHQTEFDSPVDDDLENLQNSSDLKSPNEDEASAGFQPVKSDDEESNQGFITEHRRSPPIDLSFKPIQTFSDTNPFGALQTPSLTSPKDQNEVIEQSNVDTPQKYFGSFEDQPMSRHDTPSSFVVAREKTHVGNSPVPFDELQSPTEDPEFVVPPDPNSSFVDSELSESLEPQHNKFEETDDLEPEIPETESSSHILLSEYITVTSPKYEETSFTETNSKKELMLSTEDLDTTEGFLEEESKIVNENEQQKIYDGDHDHGSSDTPEELVFHSEDKTEQMDSNNHEIDVVEQIEDKNDDFESETKEMNLEFESHIPSEKEVSDDLGDIDGEFEVISREELRTDVGTLSNDAPQIEEGVVIGTITPSDLISAFSQETESVKSPSNETNPFVIDDSFKMTDNSANVEDNKEIEINDSGIPNENDIILVEKKMTDPLETESCPVEEPVAAKTEFYQLLTPADEPTCMKTEVTSLTEEINLLDGEVKGEQISEIIPEIKEEKSLEVDPALCVSSPAVEEIAETVAIRDADVILSTKDEPITKNEPVQSQVVTETLIATIEETSEIPSTATSEVPSATAGAPPPTPVLVPEAESTDESEKTELLVAAVAAAGAVAAGASLVANKTKKEPSGPSKKPTPISKKPGDTSTTKAPTKAGPAKPAAGKPATAKTSTATTKPAPAGTTKLGVTATKPTGAPVKASTAGLKTASTKPASVPMTTKNPSASAKPTAPKPSSATAAKPATAGATKAVPKHLPVSITATTFKPTSKPTTPTSKPTTPTTPKSPSVTKTDVKSPGRPPVKSNLTANKGSVGAKPDTSFEKKSLSNGEVKPPAKKPATSTTTKPSFPAARPSAPQSKSAPLTKALTAVTKPAAPKPTSTVAKAKPASAPAAKAAGPAPIKRPGSVTAVKSADKTVKETANNKLANSKPAAVNGKTVPAKNVNGPKKTDAKVIEKPNKTTHSKKEVDTENEIPARLQEDNVTTTNGFGGHDEHIDENGIVTDQKLSPIILEHVN